MEEKMALDDDVNVDVLLNSTKVSQQDFDSVIVKVSELHFDRTSNFKCDLAFVARIPLKSLPAVLHRVKKSNVFQKALGGSTQTDKNGVAYLDSVTLMLRTMLSDKRVYENVPRQLSDLVVSLHSTIFSLVDNEVLHLQGRIASLCQFYISKKFPQFESVVTQTLPYFLVKSMSGDGKNMDVRSLYQVRSAFGLLDVDDESFENFKELILRAFMHPCFLDRSKHNDGIKFLAYLMTHLGKNMLKDIHEVVKMQMMDASSAMLNSYGSIYFEAWCIAMKEGDDEECTHDPDARLNIETYLIQNLLHHGIHAANPKVLKTVRTCLGVFFSKKEVDGVDAMCCRVYKPLIWRALSAANPLVRSNATVLLAEVFPLHDPEAPHSESAEMMKKQCDSFSTLLKDNDPRVRVVAIKGVCRILGLFWQLLPANSVQSLLTTMVVLLAHDNSSSQVRAAVFEGLSFVLDNCLSHGILKKLLPSLSACLHDTSERVRASFAKMLLTVKSLRTIRFFDVVNLNSILDRLAEDRSRKRVASPLTALLLNSFFPRTGGRERQLGRALALLRRHPDAAFAFFEHLHEHVPLGDVCKLFAMMSRTVLQQLKGSTTTTKNNKNSTIESTPEIKARGRRKRKSEEDEQDEEEAEDIEESNTTATFNISHILLAMEALHFGSRRKLSRSNAKSANEYLSKAICKDGTMMTLLNHFENDDVSRSIVWRLVGAVVESEVPELRSKKFDVVRRAQKEIFGEGEGCVDALRLLCRWGDEGNAVRRVVSSTMSWLGVKEQDDDVKKKRSRKGHARQSVSPAKCLHILEFLLGGDGAYGARDRFLDSEVGSKLCECLFKTTMSQIRDRMMVLVGGDDEDGTSTSNAENSTLLLRSLLLHCRMVLHETIGDEENKEESKTRLGDTPLKLLEVYRAVTQDVASILLQSKKAMMQAEISSSSNFKKDDDVSSPPRARRRAKTDTKKETLRRRHEISNARALGWNVICAVLTVASECVSLGFGDGPFEKDIKTWAKALKTSGGLFAPIVMERFGDLTMSLYRRSRYEPELATNGNVVLQSVVESTGQKVLDSGVSKELKRCISIVLRDQCKRTKGLETVIPVLLTPLIAAAAQNEDDDEDEEKKMTTYRVLCDLICSNSSYTKVSLKITMDLLDQGFENLDEVTTVTLLRLLKTFTDSSEMLTKIFAMDLRRLMKRLQMGGTDTSTNFCNVEDTKLSTFDKVPVPSALADTKTSSADNDEDWEDTPIGMAVSDLRENLSRLSVGGTTNLVNTPLVK